MYSMASWSPEPVGALHRVVHVPAPVVLAHVAKRRTDAALGGDGVTARREDLGEAGGGQAGFGQPYRRAQPRAARADDDHIVGVVARRSRTGS